MLDCFVSTLGVTPARIGFARKTLTALMQSPNIRLTVLDAGSLPEQLEWFEQKGINYIPIERVGSHYRRYTLAEELAETRDDSEYFLLGDDDCVPVSDNWLERALKVADTRRNFAQFLFRLTTTDFPSDCTFTDGEVRAVNTGGGLRLIRKGCRKVEYPGNSKEADDLLYRRVLLESGYATGMFLNIYVDHIGRVESTYSNCIPLYQ